MRQSRDEQYGDDHEEDDYEPYFTGECTCEHLPDEHGWIGCNAEGCTCEACWEE